MKDLPEYDENLACENPECKHIEAEILTGLYGLTGGGGLGVYTACEHCGTVLSKSIDPEDQPNEPTEIKSPENPNAQGDGQE